MVPMPSTARNAYFFPAALAFSASAVVRTSSSHGHSASSAFIHSSMMSVRSRSPFASGTSFQKLCAWALTHSASARPSTPPASRSRR